ncbi:hypothetical protein ARMSODRAFT_979455 [Armillaria solidipes]|uniref:Uncharacterized protein n=1 Tax=Armillaria solidipes TaxID=1076256 RepID=A0A2H3BDG9_9AGAR|nr:hypothetical protein ARMSODRAFT_979455 [Armillaria solidipes]
MNVLPTEHIRTQKQAPVPPIAGNRFFAAERTPGICLVEIMACNWPLRVLDQSSASRQAIPRRRRQTQVYWVLGIRRRVRLALKVEKKPLCSDGAETLHQQGRRPTCHEIPRSHISAQDHSSLQRDYVEPYKNTRTRHIIEDDSTGRTRLLEMTKHVSLSRSSPDTFEKGKARRVAICDILNDEEMRDAVDNANLIKVATEWQVSFETVTQLAMVTFVTSLDLPGLSPSFCSLQLRCRGAQRTSKPVHGVVVHGRQVIDNPCDAFHGGYLWPGYDTTIAVVSMVYEKWTQDDEQSLSGYSPTGIDRARHLSHHKSGSASNFPSAACMVLELEPQYISTQSPLRTSFRMALIPTEGPRSEYANHSATARSQNCVGS